jgi:2-polyprenyl-3-methyl-5-hydroxy-6-metoxy-1,4-benzoquinol methylase
LVFTPQRSIAKIKEEKFLQEYLAEEKLYRKYFQNKLDLIEKYKKPSKLLDIGCGAGTFLQVAKNRGWQILGVEISGLAVDHVKKKGIRIREGIFEEMKIREKFDVITVFQTIEHAIDPLIFLQKVRNLLKPQGLLILTTPDQRGFLARLMGKRWFEYYNHEHNFFLNQKSLSLLLQKTGFDKIKINSEAGRILSLSWVLIRIFDYYYTKPGFLRNIAISTRSFWKKLDRIKLYEPSANLVALAIKGKNADL